MDQAAPLPEWRADHSAARVLLAITGQQRLEGALIGGAREELLTIDQIEQAHWLAVQGMDDVPVVDQVCELLSPGGSPVLGFAPDSALEEAVTSELVSKMPIPWLLGKIQGIPLRFRRDRL